MFKAGDRLPTDPAMLGAFIGTSLLMVSGDCVSGMAWWTLKGRKPSGRAWAILASLLNLPIPVFSNLRASSITVTFLHLSPELVGTLLGVAGLIAYLPKAAPIAPPKPPKNARMAGDGTSTFLDYFAQGLSIAILSVSFQLWSRWATRHDLLQPDVLPLVVQFLMATVLSNFGHESGHLFAGWASRKMLYSFRVGPFSWANRSGKWKFSLRLRKFYGGAVAMASRDLANVRSRKAFSLMGGPVGSLLTGSLCFAAAMTAPGHAWEPAWPLLSMMASFSAVGFLGNLIPQKTATGYSDGAQLYQVAANGPWARVHYAFAMLTTSLVTPLRLRDFDIAVLDRAAETVPQGSRGLLLRLFASKYYFDNGQLETGIVRLIAAEALYDQRTLRNPVEICSEFAFLNAFYKRDLDAANFWWSRVEAAGQFEKDADYWRGRTAVLWLKGQREEARDAWVLGHAMASQLPATGAYDATRWDFAQLRRVLDKPAPLVPKVLNASAEPLHGLLPTPVEA